MVEIKFKAKIHDVQNVDGSLAFRMIKVPELTRSHCDMRAFRQHPAFGGLANSDIFPSALRRIRKERLGERIRLDRAPKGVTIDETGFLAIVSFQV